MYYYIFGLQCYSILKFVNFLSMQTWITSLGGLNQPSFSQTFQLCGYVTYQTKLNKPLGNDHFFLDKDSLLNQAFKTIYLEVIGIQWNLPLVSSCLLLHRKRKSYVYLFTISQNTPILFSLLKIAIINKLTALVHGGGKVGGNPSLLFLRFRRWEGRLGVWFGIATLF